MLLKMCLHGFDWENGIESDDYMPDLIQFGIKSCLFPILSF